ncbi:probable LRR receptor-like serine/threonine-protein kinase At3g47570 [Ipomoea triloba]|uniref:probable LRR receptor-like serine/threonine-protein kinase At3g47570 n=1 Tax=Ipomoea triloba TaxID=35885 RepID=UPI00125D5190|nr:probable LRR receptor-like serine/threonine-protein kinase At3g47570 [Ipomoea triloba]XP_031118781.1 probable LRR receptor-like serine/threonine-protein kinase At3g47570 [Ipomoea triloba]
MEITRHYFCLSIFFLHSLMVCSTINAHTNITTDKHALLSLKSKISFDPHSVLANNWSVNSMTPCTWIGVTCNSRHNRVAALDLSNMGLVGELTPDLGNLSFLVSLNLSQNNFHNSFPRELSQLRRLKILQCSINDFSGNIPSLIGLLSNLRFLYLGNNDISGFLPMSLFNLSKLEVLHLGVNSVEGSIPREIGNLPQLKWLNLSHNHLSGSFPLGILNLSKLETLSLSANSLFGELPFNLGNHLPKLQTLNMSSNKFNGQIPSSLSECSLLQTISLPYNNFSGPIPREFENLTKLESLNLRSNQLTGAIPSEIGALSYLGELLLSNNKLHGALPKEIGNLTALKMLFFDANNLEGVIPKELGKLHMLEEVSVQFANLSGSIPKEVFNISSLKIISFAYNNLVGVVPSSMGHALLNLEGLYLDENYLNGVIPDSISNCSKLIILDLGANHFSGTLPASLGNLRLLTTLNLSLNMLINDVASLELSIINSLVNCNYLEYVYLDENPLDAILPSSIGNLSSYLQVLTMLRCGLKGIIPNELGNLSSLIALDLDSNNLVGFIPPMLRGVSKLQELDLSNNKLSGSIPNSLCDLHYLYDLQLSNNQLCGNLLKCFGNTTSLRKMYLDSNRLTSRIPLSLWHLKDLLELDLSSNFLDGFITNGIEGLKTLSLLNMSHNQISGNIPATIGQLQNLISLSLEGNKLEGSIPEQISQIVSLESLDLSLNKLSGSIPVSLERLSYLKYFNVSFNELSGEIPSAGCFKNFSSASFMFNKELCGNPRFHVPFCHSTHHSRLKIKLLITLAVLGASLVITFVIIAFVLTKRKRKFRVPSMIDIGFPWDKLRISYNELLRATSCFSQNNLIGSGSFSSVYKGTLDDGMLIAVKVFNQSEDALDSFNVEIEVLKNLRHRNLTKVITGCFAEEFKALVLEYMLNESLDQWLHSQRNFLDMVQRLNIMIDVACGLDYLHNGYTMPVVHCDLKPANVLLDEEMVAHVCDFSVTKLLTKEESFKHTETLATLGYMAPEYGSTGMISTQCDIYSFGIVLMETFSARRPSDETFGEDMNLKSWINDSLPHHVLQVVDPNLLKAEDEDFNAKLQCISSILELALHCAVESPQERLNAEDVGVRMNKIKLQFLRSVGT